MARPRFLELQNPSWLKAQFDAGKSASQVARDLGCSPASVFRAAKIHNIKTPDHDAMVTKSHRERRLETWPELEDPDWFRQKHDVERLSLKAIAALLGCSTRPVSEARDRHKLAAHSVGHRKVRRLQGRSIPQLDDPVWVRQELQEKGRPLDEVAAELNCSMATVGRAARRHGIERVTVTPGRASPMKPWSIPQLLDEAWLRGEYLLKERKAKSIADELGCTVWAVHGALGRFRILKFPHRPQEKQDVDLPNGQRRHGGYIHVYKPDHVYANGRGYVPQHRLICEELLGRLLSPMEEVHHINEKRDDNRPENLIVFLDGRAHMTFHQQQPPWVPRCECCDRPRPELVAGRPSWVPLVYDHDLCYRASPPEPTAI